MVKLFRYLTMCCRPELMKSRVLELNASDERGIQVSHIGCVVVL